MVVGAGAWNDDGSDKAVSNYMQGDERPYK